MRDDVIELIDIVNRVKQISFFAILITTTRDSFQDDLRTWSGTDLSQNLAFVARSNEPTYVVRDAIPDERDAIKAKFCVISP